MQINKFYPFSFVMAFVLWSLKIDKEKKEKKKKRKIDKR